MAFVKQNIFIVLGIVCIIALGVLYLYDRSKPVAILQTSGAKIIYDANLEPSPPLSNPSAEPSSEDKPIKVYIAGAVNEPGVYEVSADARVDDVLKLAGGPTEDADLLRVNLAAHIVDAQRIIIPVEGETIATVDENTGTTDPQAYPETSPVSSSTTTNSLININTADTIALQTLPGIGPAIAGNIIDYRKENGGFKTLEELKNVDRIGEATFNKLKDLITLQ